MMMQARSGSICRAASTHGDAVHARHHQVDQQQVERFDGQQG